MIERDRPIGEDDLQAYVDGRLAPDRRAQVEAYLAERPEVGQRVGAYAGQRDELRAAFAEKAAEPIPSRLRLSAIRAARRARMRRRFASLAAALGWLAVGVAIGWSASGGFDRRRAETVAEAGGMASLPSDAINAYRTFVSEKLHAVEVDAAQEQHLVQWLSRRLGRPLMAPDLTPIGYRLMGGRLLPAGSGPAAQMMYEDQQGARLTLYLRPGGEAETSFRFMEKDGVSAFYWIDDGLSYAVSGTCERKTLLKVAESVYTQIAALANR